MDLKQPGLKSAPPSLQRRKEYAIFIHWKAERQLSTKEY